jgi:hypothetical protein
MLKRKIERKVEGVVGEGQIRFRRGKGTRQAIGMLIKLSERTREADENLCSCFPSPEGI